jgi:hypothetical protein
MGFFSYLCKECSHPLLSRPATSPGINDWMAQAVVLTNRGGRIIGEYDGYGRVGGNEEASEYGACLHEACWEKAGKPDFDHYGSPSKNAPDQGWFFDDADHDMLDPRILEDREELLAKGVEARNKARYDQRAREVYGWVHENREDIGSEYYRAPWQRRFSYGKVYEEIEQVPGSYVTPKVIEGEWYVSDKFGVLWLDERVKGTEEEVQALLKAAWETYEAGPECQALLAHALELREASQRAHHEKLKAGGRYVVCSGPSHAKGRSGYTPLFYVRDQMTYDKVAEFDYEGEGDDRKARQAKADAEAARLNAAWAAEGYPYVECPS